MSNIIPKIAAIHDMSGFGRCSLTVIIPVLSSLGIQVCPLPTAILSTHSGGFGKFFLHDLTGSMEEYANHWKSIGLEFDCVYTGFLGSAQQIDMTAKFIDDFRRTQNQLVVVDPVMADHGKLYKTYTLEMQKKMKLLVEKADIITPNMTEACFLLEEPFINGSIDNQEIKRILKKLSDFGPDIVVITSVKGYNGSFYNIGYKRSDDTFWKVDYEQIPSQYPGTGDIFTSVFTGCLLNGDNLPVAMDKATQFLSHAVRMTYECKTSEREGVLLEKALGRLMDNTINNTYTSI